LIVQFAFQRLNSSASLLNSTCGELERDDAI
jgi:hypothetical protein